MKPFVMLPTYNESENIALLIEQILRVCPSCQIVVVDDDSPDGTWRIVEEIRERDSRVHLVHRKSNRGRGISGIKGFLYALDHGADAVLEMDADFSHDPSYLPHFFSSIQEYDVVSGSRFVQGGRDADRGWLRQRITYFANLYIRIVLRIQLTDCSSGFRCYRREVLQNLNLPSMVSIGPSIVQEMLLRACQLGYDVLEIPIEFRDRQRGKTKLTYRHLINGFRMVLKLRFSKPRKKLKEGSPEVPV
ncbi:MAG: polyprenol monophosphomannose synthase [Candidatus Omnitrophota bacterium]|nr:polyprenol monophosphomannose synthase [Candidatus Omnitrophota bacterium]